MSRDLARPRLVRHADASTWDLRELLRVDKRTGFTDGRAGLSWEGVKDYQTPSGRLRVLRRKSQVEAPGHLRTLRRLGTSSGHPTEDRDLGPDNFTELYCGSTGDKIDIEAVDGFDRPVADFTCCRPAVFCTMMTADQWSEYAREYPRFAEGVQRAPGAPRSGTSLGYNALWMTPYIREEFVSDNDGEIVAAWVGPDGKTYEYDAEHVVDPDCEIVLRLVSEQDFDPDSLGGQHFALNLDTMTGRGGKQSELLRVNDAQWIGADPTHGRVTFQVPRATRSIDVTLDNARATTQVAQDTGDKPMAEKIITIGVRDRGTLAALKKLGVDTPAQTDYTTDELSAAKLQPVVAQLEAVVTELAAMLVEAGENADQVGEKMAGMEEQLADMPSVEEAKAQVAEAEAKLAEAQAAEEAAKKTSDALTVDLAASAEKNAQLVVTCDALNAELGPVRDAAIVTLRVQLVTAGLDETAAKSCKDAAELRRAFMASRDSKYAAKTGADYSYNDERIADVFDGAFSAPVKTNDEAAKGSNEYTPGAALSLLPTPKAAASTTDKKDPKPANTQPSVATLIGAAL